LRLAGAIIARPDRLGRFGAGGLTAERDSDTLGVVKDEILPPRTIAGQAALSGMRPHVKRALAQTIRRIEEEAARPYAEALREADAVLAELAGEGADGAGDTDLAERARAARERAAPLLAGPGGQGE
jgi:hypothetical protein